MLSWIDSILKKLVYRGKNPRAFIVTRLSPGEIKEKVYIKGRDNKIDISERQCMTCLDPFCMAIWLRQEELNLINPASITIEVVRNNNTRAGLDLLLIAKTPEEDMVLLLYRVDEVKCFQANPFYRFITLAWPLKNNTSTYRERKFIAALYTYPRKVIVVSYKEEGYCNIFPMDIQGYVAESGLYLLGLRNSNITLDKILANKKLVISDTGSADIKTVYSLGRHLSAAPPKPDELPFDTSNSELFGFPVPDFSTAYKEVEIIRDVNMGYHRLLVAKIVNEVKLKQDDASLYHVHYFEFKNSGYENIVNEGYS
jgi:flavin reductase (DIM6/NTAB) family NADH-FMN oxidoreductase RutF